MKKEPAFTLIEMIISITVFTLFVGAAVSSYLYFHRVQQDLVSSRALLFEAQSILDSLNQKALESVPDYEAYSASQTDVLGAFQLSAEAISGSSLFLKNDEGEHWIYAWDEASKSLQISGMDEAGNPLPGFREPISLNSQQIQVDSVRFTLFPPVSPEADGAILENNLQYQPFVRVDLDFSTSSRVKESLSVDLHTMITFRKNS